MKNKKQFLNENEILTLRAARIVLRKIKRKIDSLNEIRTAEFDKSGNVLPDRWKTTTQELYDLLDETYKKGHVSNVACVQPPSDYPILDL